MSPLGVKSAGRMAIQPEIDRRSMLKFGTVDPQIRAEGPDLVGLGEAQSGILPREAG